MEFRVVAIGCSWGGLDALGVLLGQIGPEIDAAIVVAQHRPVDPHSGMARSIERRSSLPVREAEDKETIEPGIVYLAPPDYHLLVEPGAFALSTEAAVQFARPSIDVLFESTARAYGDRGVGVILTGANDDGSKGVVEIKRHGGVVVVQDPATAKRPEMPRAAVRAVAPDAILALEEIGAYLHSICGPKRNASEVRRG